MGTRVVRDTVSKTQSRNLRNILSSKAKSRLQIFAHASHVLGYQSRLGLVDGIHNLLDRAMAAGYELRTNNRGHCDIRGRLPDFPVQKKVSIVRQKRHIEAGICVGRLKHMEVS